MTRRDLFQNAVLGALGLAGSKALAQDTKPPKAFEGEDVFAKLLEKATAEGWAKLPIGERVGRIGLELLETPYVAFTLELWTDREACVINLKGLDCVTFFESSLGFARMLARGGKTPADLVREVTFTRYRGGILGDYSTRLHYTMDWMYDNQQKGSVELITKSLPGSEPFRDRVNFMSRNFPNYKQLKENPDLVQKIFSLESEINERQTYFVPVSRIESVEPLLKTGDIVGITAGQRGLDCAHTGICYRNKQGVLRFLHASQSGKKVMLDKRLSEYLNGFATGAMFARPLDVPVGKNKTE